MLPQSRIQKQGAHVTDEKSTEIETRVVHTLIDVNTIESEAVMRWIGPETIVGVILEEHEVAALADSGSQVNTIMPEFVSV